MNRLDICMKCPNATVEYDVSFKRVEAGVEYIDYGQISLCKLIMKQIKSYDGDNFFFAYRYKTSKNQYEPYIVNDKFLVPVGCPYSLELTVL